MTSYIYTNIELISILKKYKRDNKLKIPNIHKMKKDDIIELCTKFKLLDVSDVKISNINPENLTKKQLLNDISVFLCKQGKNIENINKLKRDELIEYFNKYSIPHISDDQLKKECIEILTGFFQIKTRGLSNFCRRNINPLAFEKKLWQRI